MGSNYYPWGPHGERVSPLEVKPNPTPSKPAPQFDSTPDYSQSAAPAAGGYYGGYPSAGAGTYTGYTGSYSGVNGGAGIARVGGFFVSLVVVGFFWQFFVCLYPLAAIAAGFTTLYSAGLLVKFLPADPMMKSNGFLAAVLGCAAGIVVLYVASRIEQRLAEHSWYRIPRHIVRLALFGLMGVYGIERANGIEVWGRGELSISAESIVRVLRVPEYLISVVVFVVVMHLVLWKGEMIRRFWHRRLEALGLRAR